MVKNGERSEDHYHLRFSFIVCFTIVELDLPSGTIGKPRVVLSDWCITNLTQDMVGRVRSKALLALEEMTVPSAVRCPVVLIGV